MVHKFINRSDRAALLDEKVGRVVGALRRIAAMMDAAELYAAPALYSGSVRATPETEEEVVVPGGLP